MRPKQRPVKKLATSSWLKAGRQTGSSVFHSDVTIKVFSVSSPFIFSVLVLLEAPCQRVFYKRQSSKSDFSSESSFCVRKKAWWNFKGWVLKPDLCLNSLSPLHWRTWPAGTLEPVWSSWGSARTSVSSSSCWSWRGCRRCGTANPATVKQRHYTRCSSGVTVCEPRITFDFAASTVCSSLPQTAGCSQSGKQR